MEQKEFIIDFFNDEDMVKVNAIKLQDILQKYEERKKDCEILNCRVDTLETMLEIEKEKNKKLQDQLQDYIPVVDLKI